MRVANGTIGSITLCAAVTIAATSLSTTSMSHDVDVGKLAFNENCAVCHGVQGTGQDREPYWRYAGLGQDV